MLEQLNLRRKSLRRNKIVSQNRGRSFESLEARQVMAGNVTATVDNLGQLLITGDSAANGIYLTQVGQSKFEVKGFAADGAATTINGSNATLTLSGVTGNISIINGNGNDAIQVDYLNHTGNLSIDAREGHDSINIGTSNKASYLVGDLTLGYAQSHTVNLLNTNVVGEVTAEYTGLILTGSTTRTNLEYYQPVVTQLMSPLVNSYAITSCSFSSDVTIEGHGRAIQAFIESSHIGGKLTIENSSETLNSSSSLSVNPSFIVLNNVSAKEGLEVEIFSSTSFVMNGCTIDSGASISLYGKTNIYQISNSVFKETLATSNVYFNPILPLPTLLESSESVNEPSPLYQSKYDIVQLNNVKCVGEAILVSNGTASAKHSEFSSLIIVAKKLVMMNEVKATNAQVYLTNLTGRTFASILGSTLENLTIAADVRNIHSFNVKIVDTTVTGITSIEGRGDVQVCGCWVEPGTPVFSTANANVLIDKSKLGTFYYSYYVTDYSPSQIVEVIDGREVVTYLPTQAQIRSETETYLGLYGGSGIDKITVRESTIDKFFAQLGAGNDSLTFHESKIITGGYADGNDGSDTLLIDNASKVSKATFVNFEISDAA